ncbi:alanine-glyoxylate transaminase/serine-glyoxylate transaminase/serine-pyruvate transaminase [Arthrobacter sp. JUb119]|uniref:pyridoxal-phosphate-dependent aminotransferase family protein n=2 Tax=Micrococcales TaxID=85006 RepID=UPI000CFCE679|nr:MULTISPECIES: alanine--glyoxylate aminotransferase family protein [unclassified Arthrobacter]MCS3492690.1 alanine-glyoxylate transaminase/serine-glyoxylate transaminase/serine-pyruvate transaminase [Arthrobacter sp. JUb119]PRB76958.1 alanine--glyoxylate aminotransferase [Arthrobacter sp. MYb214]TDU30152.1 alanine-glyoxylate aminotransferase [Arthrobacter sp. JUb115]
MSKTVLQRHLFGPGPCNPYPEATAALGLPLLGHLDPEFIARMDRVADGLRTLWGTGNSRTLPLSATGSAGMEAAFVNTINPGDVAVIAINGLFGERMCEVAARAGAEVVRVEHEYGTPIDAERVAAAHPNPTVIAGVHAETSTGVVSDIAALGAIKGDALLITDAVTSIGGMPVLADEWGIDVGYAGTQKCLGVAPGLAPFTISDRAFERRVQKPQSWYLDLGLLGGYATGSTGGQRTYHHTAPVSMVASLEAGIDRILAEGLDAVTARHQEAGGLLQDGLQEMGLELFAQEGYRLPQLTTVYVPEGVDSAKVRGYLLDRFNIEIGGGVGKYASTVWRIGMMGPNANPGSVALLLAALKEAIGKA